MKIPKQNSLSNFAPVMTPNPKLTNNKKERKLCCGSIPVLIIVDLFLLLILDTACGRRRRRRRHHHSPFCYSCYRESPFFFSLLPSKALLH
jgi:hypothetical protein